MTELEGDLAHLVGNITEIRWPHNSRFAFPSKVGGKAAWLVPENIPNTQCEICKRNMTFLMQIYAPDSEKEESFHRSLMVFTCLHCRCFLRCFRSQLPLVNPYYSTQAISDDQIPRADSVLDHTCCDTCGCLNHGVATCHALPEYGLEIEEIDEIDLVEEDDDAMSDESDDSESSESRAQSANQMNLSTDTPIDESEMSLFNDFTDTAIERDASFRAFKTFTEHAPVDHVIYYCLGGSPVWLTEQNQLPGQPPNCEQCGSERRFEFQIQPQLIYHIMRKLRGFPMTAAPFEWGVVTIYTCSKDCGPGNAYKEEFVYNQLEPAEWLEFNSRKKVDFAEDKKAGKSAPQLKSKDESDDEGDWE